MHPTPIEGVNVALPGVFVDGPQKKPPENAYIVEDYPNGFTARVRKAYWVERALKGAAKGQFRLVTATTNKHNREVWCSPQTGIYSDVIVLYLNGEPGDKFGHVLHDAAGLYNNRDRLLAFKERWESSFNDQQRFAFDRLIALSKHVNKSEWSEPAPQPATV